MNLLNLKIYHCRSNRCYRFLAGDINCEGGRWLAMNVIRYVITKQDFCVGSNLLINGAQQLVLTIHGDQLKMEDGGKMLVKRLFLVVSQVSFAYSALYHHIGCFSKTVVGLISGFGYQLSES